MEVIGWNFLDLKRWHLPLVQKFHNMEVLVVELNGTSSVKDYPKLRSFIIWKLLAGTYWILQDGSLPLVQKFHNMELLVVELVRTYNVKDYHVL